MIQHNDAQSRFSTAYWNEWSPKIIETLILKQVARGEWHGACPNCGGTDRFWISELASEVKVHCRQCWDFPAITKAMRDLKIWPQEREALPRTVKQDIPWPVPSHDTHTDLHPYLSAKKIKQHNAIEQDGLLQIPIINAAGKMVGKQSITADGKKRFTKGMEIVGNFSVLNGPITDFAYVAEGWATAASVAEATGKPCVFALNASNLTHVCEALITAKPQAELLIAADNDEAGIKAAEQAKADHGVDYVLPPSGMDYNDVWVQQGPDAVKRALRPVRLVDSVFWPDDAKPILSNTYLVKRWLGDGQLSCVYGQSNVGKSFLTLDLAYHIAANRPWHGHRVSGGPVLYMATEGGNAFRNRVYALNKKYGYEGVPLAVRPAPVDLYNETVDMPTIERLCAEIGTERGKLRMIVVDTLSRAMAGANENTAEDMSRFISNLDMLRIATGAHILIVHHSGKDASKGARGSSALRAALDTEIELEIGEDEIRMARATKQRDMEGNAVLGFRLAVEALGEDEDGDQVTTCVIDVLSQEDVQAATKKPKGKNQELVEDCFVQLRGEGVGGPNPSGPGWPQSSSRWIIAEEELKEHFAGKCGAKNPRDAYKTAIEGMISTGLACRNDGKIWFITKASEISKSS